MYSYEERIRTVKLYIKHRKRTGPTIGSCPDCHCRRVPKQSSLLRLQANARSTQQTLVAHLRKAVQRLMKQECLVVAANRRRRYESYLGEISAASLEQSTGVAQVGEAVTQMDHATQQNAALVEQMAAAANSLKSQAHDLVGTVAIFKLTQGR